MKTHHHLLLGILALFLAPLALQAAKPAKPTSTPEPSVHLRQLIDITMRKISNISDAKQPPLDRTSLMVAQAEYTARLQTALPAQQPMYQAALNVVNSLVAAVEEHEKAVADFHYSKNVHGKQDREDAKVANWQRGPDAGAAARADNAKQQMENEASRKALLDKEKFMNNGALALWTQRVGQLHDAVEQTFTTELVSEQKLAMLTPPAPLTAPTPKPAHKTKEPSASEQYSPVGAWKTSIPGNRPAILKEDNTTVSTGVGSRKGTGTWKWTDQSKGALAIIWSDGLKSDVNLSADGQTMSGTASNGKQVWLFPLHDGGCARCVCGGTGDCENQAGCRSCQRPFGSPRQGRGNFPRARHQI